MIELSAFVREHPDAVFVRRARATSFEDRERFREAGYAIARDLLTATDHAPDGRTFVLKPNVVNARIQHPQTGEMMNADRGIVTDVDFVGGIIQWLQEMDAKEIIIAEGGSGTPMRPLFEDRGYVRLAEETGVRLADLNKEPGTYAEEELNWTPVDGVVFREVPFVRPINNPNAVLINVPTMKTHNLGIISLCGKNLQGTIAMGYRHFCAEVVHSVTRLPGATAYYQPDLLKALTEHFERHVQEGYPKWDMGGLTDEAYAQRTCDAVQAIHGTLNIVEGVIGRDGTAFHHGKDVLANLTIAGVNTVHVDAITAYLMGHNPQNIAYLKVANERRLGTNDPEQIPVYLLTDDGPMPCTHPSEIGRLALGVYHRGDTSKYVFF